MSAPARTKRLVYLRNQMFRYILQSGKPKYGPGYYAMQWASCAEEPQTAETMIVTNPGTSFERLEIVPPKFASFTQFPKPCGIDNEE